MGLLSQFTAPASYMHICLSLCLDIITLALIQLPDMDIFKIVFFPMEPRLQLLQISLPDFCPVLQAIVLGTGVGSL